MISLPFGTCNAAFQKLDPTSFCATPREIGTTCQGDSGSGIVSDRGGNGRWYVFHNNLKHFKGHCDTSYCLIQGGGRRGVVRRGAARRLPPPARRALGIPADVHPQELDQVRHGRVMAD